MSEHDMLRGWGRRLCLERRRRWAMFWCLIGLFLMVIMSSMAADFASQRQRMIDEIQDDVRLTSHQLGRTDLDERVLQTLAKVPRHAFVPIGQRDHAYENRPLPIGFGQTISQPYIVAIMTDLLGLEPDHVVFELGTGSGYQAAVLAQLSNHVYTMEIIKELGSRANQTLDRLGYANVTVRVGDGYDGWEERGPFDAIMVTAAGDHIPPSLIRQLKPGGRMIIPVGSRFFTQQLMLIEKSTDGSVRTQAVLPVRFVPLTGGH